MNYLRLFGIGADRILRQNHWVSGTVTKHYRCWWCTVNTKRVRRFSGDGAIYPHIITFTYQIDGVSYEGKLWVAPRSRAPQCGESIDVYYDPKKPENYACFSFGSCIY